MHKDAVEHVKTCSTCQARDKRNYENPTRVVEPPVINFQWHLDCVVMANEAGMIEGLEDISPRAPKRYMVVARENVTGWAEARAVTNLTSDVVSGFFLEEILPRFGATMRVVVVDNGGEFQGRFADLVASYKIGRVTISPHNPAANGLVERGHSPLKEAIYRRLRETPGSRWSDHLPYALWADRCTVRRSTGMTPYFLMYGHDCVLPIDVKEVTRMLSNWEAVRSHDDVLVARMAQLERRPEEVRKAMDRLRSSRESSVDARNDRNELKQRDREFLPGDLVSVRDAARDKTHRTREGDRYWGPFRVIRKGVNGAFTLSELDGTQKKGKIAGNRVRRWYPRQDIEEEDRREAAATAPHSNDRDETAASESDDSDRYEVSEIIDSRRYVDKIKYRVKWKGWGNKGIQWIDAADFHQDDVVVADFHRRYPTKPIHLQ